MSIQDVWLQSEHAVHQVPVGIEQSVEFADQAGVSSKERFARTQQMSRGVISKVVSSYGSEWGRIRPAGLESECFFNRASLIEPDDFEGLEAGQAVEFDDEPDRVHGTRAVHIARVSQSAGVGQ